MSQLLFFRHIKPLADFYTRCGALGNFYGLDNPYDRTARIFFAQGSYMTGAEVNAEDDVGSTGVEGLAEGGVSA